MNGKAAGWLLIGAVAFGSGGISTAVRALDSHRPPAITRTLRAPSSDPGPVTPAPAASSSAPAKPKLRAHVPHPYLFRRPYLMRSYVWNRGGGSNG